MMENTNSQSVDHTQELPKALQLGGLKISVGDRELLSDTNHTIAPGKITVIVGGSGAGKSVLLRSGPRSHQWPSNQMGRHDPKRSRSGYCPSTPANDEQSGAERRIVAEATVTGQPRIGIVFQQFALFDELTPAGNVQFAIDHRNDASA